MDGPGPDPPQCLGGVSLGIPRLGRAAVRLRGPVAAKDSDPCVLPPSWHVLGRGGGGGERRERAHSARLLVREEHGGAKNC